MKWAAARTTGTLSAVEGPVQQSWLTILRKRENFRAAFGGFEPATVAGFGPADEARLLADPGIVRNRAKISAVIRNAQAALAVPGGLAALVWRYAGPPAPAPVTLADVPAQTPASRACARELRGLGFSFVGPVTVYAALQACGVVDDHLASASAAGCVREVWLYSPDTGPQSGLT
jgi:DNA-3-methyladenine glycosylase I